MDGKFRVYCVAVIHQDALVRSFLERLWTVLGDRPRIQTFTFTDDDIIAVGDPAVTAIQTKLSKQARGHIEIHVNDIDMAERRLEAAGLTVGRTCCRLKTVLGGVRVTVSLPSEDMENAYHALLTENEPDQ